MELFLTALSGLAWTIVYIEAIRLGIKYKTYAMTGNPTPQAVLLG